MSDMEKFFTRQKAQEGKKVPLSLPDGSPTEHWIVIRGIDSDSYAEAMAAERRMMIDNTVEVDGKTKIDPAITKDAPLRVLASLVAAWSFEEECNTKNVINLLKEAPQLREELDTITADRKYFFGEEGSGSQSSSPRKRSSRSQSRKNPS